jgi:hypothetical protein
VAGRGRKGRKTTEGKETEAVNGCEAARATTGEGTRKEGEEEAAERETVRAASPRTILRGGGKREPGGETFATQRRQTKVGCGEEEVEEKGKSARRGKTRKIDANAPCSLLVPPRLALDSLSACSPVPSPSGAPRSRSPALSKRTGGEEQKKTRRREKASEGEEDPERKHCDFKLRERKGVKVKKR